MSNPIAELISEQQSKLSDGITTSSVISLLLIAKFIFSLVKVTKRKGKKRKKKGTYAHGKRYKRGKRHEADTQKFKINLE